MIQFLYNNISEKLYQRDWLKHSAYKLEKFRNIHEGEDCFIIGNGPSLNKMDLSLLNDYYTFGLNKIYMIFDRNPFQLSYHVAINPLVVEQIKSEMSKLNCESFLSYLPQRKNKIHGDNIYTLGDIIDSQLFYKDITQGLRQGATVTYTAMQIAYYMGFKRIFLIGVDHNFFQQGNPNEKQKMNEDDPNHFDPNYFKGQEWHLADLENSEVYYLIAKYFYENKGCQILDATINGKLKIFEKISFQEALKKAKGKRTK